eukprot:comp23205_c0_seq1/m.37703 comp23205_c0_seq1/g.37703  ORF comp23205_c0_seq1/g.37703 comp23205_c0_seq1/m.37703 type:complete len:470 (-) comp23205_c0_seq1:78-1487(-)
MGVLLQTSLAAVLALSGVEGSKKHHAQAKVLSLSNLPAAFQPMAAGDAANQDLSTSSTATPACIYTKSWKPRNNPAILFPLYTVGTKESISTGTVCTNELIYEVSKGCRAVTAVVNPQSGPLPRGDKQIAAMRTCMKLLDDHNVTMVGYVHTKLTRKKDDGTWDPYAMRPPSEVQDDMNIWMEQTKGLVNFKGFFLDDTSSHWETAINRLNVSGGHISWYRKLVAAARSTLKDAIVVLNPGSFVDLRLMLPDPADNYTKPADITIPYEDYAWRWRPPNNDCSVAQATLGQAGSGTFEPGPWCRNIPKWDQVEDFKRAVTDRRINVSAVVHSATCNFAFQEVLTAKNAGFRYFYATDATLSGNGPWYRVPTFWDAYLRFLDLGETYNYTTEDYQCGGPFSIPNATLPTTVSQETKPTFAPVPSVTETAPYIIPTGPTSPVIRPSDAQRVESKSVLAIVSSVIALVVSELI